MHTKSILNLYAPCVCMSVQGVCVWKSVFLQYVDKSMYTVLGVCATCREY